MGTQGNVILVSACLVDMQCRYDGRSVRVDELISLLREARVLPLCPEVAGGLGVPREPADIVGGTGEDVLDGRARVITRSGRDVTAEFVRGAHYVLALALKEQVDLAILKSRSPSCGVGAIRTPGGGLAVGSGVLAALLRRHGIRVMSEEEWLTTQR